MAGGPWMSVTANIVDKYIEAHDIEAGLKDILKRFPALQAALSAGVILFSPGVSEAGESILHKLPAETRAEFIQLAEDGHGQLALMLLSEEDRKKVFEEMDRKAEERLKEKQKEDQKKKVTPEEKIQIMIEQDPRSKESFEYIAKDYEKFLMSVQFAGPEVMEKIKANFDSAFAAYLALEVKPESKAEKDFYRLGYYYYKNMR
jgi:hypothetical protein